mgnify:CR=1 FL=1
MGYGQNLKAVYGRLKSSDDRKNSKFFYYRSNGRYIKKNQEIRREKGNSGKRWTVAVGNVVKRACRVRNGRWKIKWEAQGKDKGVCEKLDSKSKVLYYRIDMILGGGEYYGRKNKD